jgi:hypothetical protein
MKNREFCRKKGFLMGKIGILVGKIGIFSDFDGKNRYF